MTSSYNRLTIKRFPRVQERETAEARYWRNFTNPEVQVSGRLVQFFGEFLCDVWTTGPPSSHRDVPSPRACDTCLEVHRWRDIRCTCAVCWVSFSLVVVVVVLD